MDQVPGADARGLVEAFPTAPARYVEQARLGTSASRNLALSLASGAIIATTDDDCVPDPDWLCALARTFAGAPVPAAVTGAILAPLGPRPPGAVAISLRTGNARVDFRGTVQPWIVGSGGNFAARCDVLRRHGGWDERLGPNTPAQAAEDLELIYRILRHGGLVRYEPAAIVRHAWQSQDRRLVTRSAYGRGIGALCVLSLRQADPFAIKMLLSYGLTHLRALLAAMMKLDSSLAGQHRRALAALAPGVAYGLRAPARIASAPGQPEPKSRDADGPIETA